MNVKLEDTHRERKLVLKKIKKTKKENEKNNVLETN